MRATRLHYAPNFEEQNRQHQARANAQEEDGQRNRAQIAPHPIAFLA